MSHTHHHTGDQADILDLDADVVARHTASIAAWLPVETAPRHIVDLGCGTGAGTRTLLERFPTARVTAVDASAAHLDRLREHAVASGAADRVHLVQADLDATPWPALGTPDLVWASASLHHLADPDGALRRLRELLAPAGLLAVVELAGFPRFLPPDAPADAPGLEERCHAARDHQHAAHLPYRGADWGDKLTHAGLTVAGQRTVDVRIGPPAPEAVRRYALASWTRMRGNAAATLDARDLAAFDALLDPGSPDGLAHRPDLTLRSRRQVWAARRA